MRKLTKKYRLKQIGFVLAFGLIGATLILISHAATKSLPFEAENGKTKGGANVINDSTASGGQAIQFAPKRFSTSGNTILDSAGKPFIPLGVTIFGLTDSGWSDNNENRIYNPNYGDMAQINAATTFWHTNIIRIQVTPLYLLNNTPGFKEALQAEVAAVRATNQVAMIVPQYEATQDIYENPGGPDQTTAKFWKIIAPMFADDPYVWFETYNEPFADFPYSLWRDGGHQCRTSDPTVCFDFVGNQTLVNQMRADAPNNLVVVAGLNNSLANIISSKGDFTLSNANIVYSVHPYLRNNVDPPAIHDASWWQPIWEANWGLFAGNSATTKLPIFASEWGLHDATGTFCQPNAVTLVPAFLRYLSAKKVGITGYALWPDHMINGNLITPNTLNGTLACQDTHPAQGAGGDLLLFFTNKGRFP